MGVESTRDGAAEVLLELDGWSIFCTTVHHTTPHVPGLFLVVCRGEDMWTIEAFYFGILRGRQQPCVRSSS